MLLDELKMSINDLLVIYFENTRWETQPPKFINLAKRFVSQPLSPDDTEKSYAEKFLAELKMAQQLYSGKRSHGDYGTLFQTLSVVLTAAITHCENFIKERTAEKPEKPLYAKFTDIFSAAKNNAGNNEAAVSEQTPVVKVDYTDLISELTAKADQIMENAELYEVREATSKLQLIATTLDALKTNPELTTHEKELMTDLLSKINRFKVPYEARINANLQSMVGAQHRFMPPTAPQSSYQPTSQDTITTFSAGKQ